MRVLFKFHLDSDWAWKFLDSPVIGIRMNGNLWSRLIPRNPNYPSAVAMRLPLTEELSNAAVKRVRSGK